MKPVRNTPHLLVILAVGQPPPRTVNLYISIPLTGFPVFQLNYMYECSGDVLICLILTELKSPVKIKIVEWQHLLLFPVPSGHVRILWVDIYFFISLTFNQ